MKKVLCLLLAVSLLGFIGAFDSARGELLIREGFDDFDSSVRPFGWIFNNCNADADTYTAAGDYGVSSPSLKMDATDDRATSRTFETSDDSKLLFWIKCQGSDGNDHLLAEESSNGSSWSTITDITILPATGTTQGPYNLPSDTTRVRFTFTKDTADGLALDDVRVQSGNYLRAWHMAWTSQGQTGLYGDATYYEFPGPDEVLGTGDDKNLLLDGGGQVVAGATVSTLLDDRLSGDPFNDTLYFMALSSPGQDHYTGLKMAVSRFNVLNYYENVRWPAVAKPGYDSLISDIGAEGANVYYYDAGDWLSGPDTTVGPSWGDWSGWDPNVTARVLAANSNLPAGGDDDNEWAGMLLIKCGETGFLTGGDQTIDRQESWVQDPENTDHSYDGAWNDLTHADFYNLGHHGSTGASSPTFMNRMAPNYATVEVAHGSGDHPTMEALDACYDAGAIQYRADLDHVIQVMVDDSDNYEIVRWQAWSTDTEGNPFYYASSPDINTAPPELVTGLTVDFANETSVVISWSDGGYDHDVYRSKFPGGDDSAGTATQPGVGFATGIYEKLTAAPISYATYTDNSWPIKEIAYYYVIASIASTNSGAYYTKQERRWSNEVSAFVPNKSPTPTPVDYEPPSPTPTPTLTPEGYQSPTPTPTPTPCNAWVWLTDLTDITLGWIEYTGATTLGIGLVYSGPGDPEYPSQRYGWIYDTEAVYHDGSEFYDHPRLWLKNEAGGNITIPEGYYFDVSHDSPDAASPLRIWLAHNTVPNGWEWLPSIGTDGTVYTDTSNCTVWKAPVTPKPTSIPTPIPTPTPLPSPAVWALQTTLDVGSDPVFSVFADSYYLFALTHESVYVWNYNTWDLITTLEDPFSVTGGGVYADSYYVYAGTDINRLYRWNNDGAFALSGSFQTQTFINNIYGDGADYIFAAYVNGNTERFDRANFNTSTVLSNAGSTRYDVFVNSYYIYAADGNKQIYAWETDTDNSFVAAFSPQSASNWVDESAAMTAVHADNSYLFAGSANTNLYEFDPGIYWNGTTDYKTRKDFATGTITAVFADPTGRYYYVSSEDNNVYAYETDWWNIRRTLSDGADDMNDVYADTEYIFGGCSDGKVYIWLARHTPSPTPPPSPTPTKTPVGYASPTPTVLPNHNVLINEVAWMGTSHSTSDEWIELFNPTGVDVNIENWSIHGAYTGVCINFASYDGFTTFTVPAGGYAIFANDPWVFWTGATESIWDNVISLNNIGGDRIILYNQPNCSAGAGVVVDIVDNDNGWWFAGEATPDRKTMERRDPSRYGIDPANWVTWSDEDTFATDSSGSGIFGSPGKQNKGYSLATPTPIQTRSPTPTVTPTPTPTPTPVSYKTPTPTPVGHKTPTPTPTPTTTPSPAVYQDVVFNELAWMGTAYGVNDEWIELYVNNGSDLDLLGWTITAYDGIPNFSIGSNTSLNTGDYVLLERVRDSVVSDIDADFVYPYYNFLHNDGEELWLKNADGYVVDHIDMSTYWWAGVNSTKYTMERVRPDWPSDKQYNWATWSAPTQSGKDAKGVDLNATAKSQNSVWSAFTSTPAVSPTPAVYLDICFNEIAWMGTDASSNHEWIEFRNNTASEINMKGFRVYTRSGNVDFTVVSDVNITAGGYYIFEPVTDYVIRDVDGYIYGYDYLSDSGERVVLESNGVIWDDIDFAEGWPAGTTDPDLYTMEKIDPTADGNDFANWSDNNGTTINGRDADDDPILGTAKAQNSVYYCVGCRRAPRAPAAPIRRPELEPMDRYQPAPASTPGGDVPTPLPAPEEPDLVRVESGDYDGDGIVDVALFRPASGLWAIRGITRLYFGITPAGVRPLSPSTAASGSDPYTGDLPVSGDYDGDGSTDVAVYRSGLWAIRDLSRVYLGTGDDVPVPGDYDGDGVCDIAVFRPATGLWVAPGIIRAYFGGADDIPIPGDYDGDGTADIGIFRSSAGLWNIKDLTLFYFGAEGDIAVPGDYDGSGLWTAGAFRPASGLWAIRDLTRLYFGTAEDQLVPGDYDGDLVDEPAIFRPKAGLWSVEGVTRVHISHAWKKI